MRMEYVVVAMHLAPDSTEPFDDHKICCFLSSSFSRVAGEIIIGKFGFCMAVTITRISKGKTKIIIINSTGFVATRFNERHDVNARDICEDKEDARTG